MTEKMSLAEMLRSRRDYFRLVRVQRSDTGRWGIALMIDGYYATEKLVDESLESFLEDFDVPEAPLHDRFAYTVKPLAAELLSDPDFVSRYPEQARQLSKLVG